MTIVLVILAVLILLAVLFLICRVNQVGNRILSTMLDNYNDLVNHFITLERIITTQVNTVTTVIGSQQEEVVRLTNKVDEGLTHCGNQTRDLKEKVNILDSRLTAPIDKINDTHNRIKTLGKGATSTDELHKVIADVVSSIATEAVDSVCQKCAPKPKTVKKAAKKEVVEVKA